VFEIGIVGMGYVGNIMNVVFQALDQDEYKIKCMDKDRSKSVENKLTEEFVNSDIIFICINTPDGQTYEIEKTLDLISLIYWKINSTYKAKLKYVIIKSTVPVGFTRKQQNKHAFFKILFNPEFLREGPAYSDFIYPSRIIIGKANETDIIEESVLKFFNSYTHIKVPILETTYENAELTKLANNAFLTMRINFINSLAEFADTNENLNIQDVSSFLQFDSRIGEGYLSPGPGIGGSCLIKDTSILIDNMIEEYSNITFFNCIHRFNSYHLDYILYRIEDLCKGKNITVLGLSFKAGTDDIRNSPSIYIVENLITMDYKITVHDPVAKLNNDEVFQIKDVYLACINADLIVVMTEWEMYAKLDFEKVALEMHGKIIYDTRNILNRKEVENAGLTYYGLGI